MYIYYTREGLVPMIMISLINVFFFSCILGFDMFEKDLMLGGEALKIQIW